MSQDREPNPLNELVVGILAVRDQVARGLQSVNQRLDGLLTPQPGSVWAEIVEAARDGRLQSAVKELTEELERTRELYESSPFAFVLEWVDFGAGRLLLEGAAEEGEELMLVVMQHALLDPEHLDLTAQAISEAPIVGPPQRADLLAAIEHLRAWRLRLSAWTDDGRRSRRAKEASDPARRMPFGWWSSASIRVWRIAASASSFAVAIGCSRQTGA